MGKVVFKAHGLRSMGHLFLLIYGFKAAGYKSLVLSSEQ
jgi:hypothetical protein